MKSPAQLLALALSLSIAAPTTFAAVQPIAAPTSSSIALEAGSGRVVRIKGRISSLFAADPKIVEVRPAGPNSVFLFGVGVGRSTVAAIDGAGTPLQQFDVTVRPSSFGATEAAAASQRMMPGSDAQFSSTSNGITITGNQPNPAVAEQEMAIASNYISDKQSVDDHSTINSGVQVTLRVRIAEISRTITRQFGINWTALANFGRWGVAGTIADGLSQASNPPNTIGVGFKSGSASINTVLDLLAQDQLITMLAEPNLTARSGETASFLAGGEFPIPIAASNGQISVAFKQYGVSLSFVPTVLTDGRISLHVRPEVSQLSSAGAVSVPIGTSLFGNSTVTIPATTVRRADTTVELGSGQSFAIAGLLTANSANDARGTPFIDELPVIGPLFKSNMFQRDESELVIVITPYIVKPVSQAGQIGAPTDGFVPAADADRVLRSRQRASGTDPLTVVAPSSAALAHAATAQASNAQPISLPAGAGFILH